jgi:hypothetical protein
MNAITLSKFVTNELSTEIQEVVFSRDTQGKYYLFGKYVIVQTPNLYKVYCLVKRTKLDFSSLKNATTWCVLSNSGNRTGATRVYNLDLKLSSIDVDIAVHKNKIKKAKTNFAGLISATKLQEDIYKRRTVVSELSYYIEQSKKIQNSKFNSKNSKIKHQR